MPAPELLRFAVVALRHKRHLGDLGCKRAATDENFQLGANYCQLGGT